MRLPENIQVRLIYLDAIELFIRIHIINMTRRIFSYEGCSGQVILAAVLEKFSYNSSALFGDNPPLCL